MSADVDAARERGTVTTGASIQCVCCGIEMTGRMMEDGRLRPSDRTRPNPDDPMRPGWCVWCYERKCRHAER